ncbi:MAG: glycerol-3-phosphate 1-O-acyltransferase PlsY [Actinobacteria bacterium]|nr:glycerol-3-phosphate 1-O-acyltransferase PlsY [Actinomycetota bacterium]
MWSTALLVLSAYLLGTFPTALLVAGRKGQDPTREGSGNPGATNVARTVGRRAGMVVLLGDVAKGAVATALGMTLGGRVVGLTCGLAAVLGHVLPVTRRFRGGKGVATAVGFVGVAFPLEALAATTVWLAVVLLTRRVAPASIALVVALPILGVVTGRPGSELAVTAGTALLVIARHRDNIVRMRRGDEPAFAADPRRVDPLVES